MTEFYSNVEFELTKFVQRANDLFNSVEITSNSSSIECLSSISFETCSRALKTFEIFLESLTSYISDCSIESTPIVSIVVESVELVELLWTHQEVFIEYAINDFLYLDEHFHLIYEKSQTIVEHLENLSNFNDEIYCLEKILRENVPSTYFRSSTICQRLALTLIDTTSNSISTLFNFDENENENDGILPSNPFFSSLPISSSFNSNETKQKRDHRKSTIQLDTIDVRTNSFSQSSRLSSFQFDLKDLRNIENDLSTQQNDFIEVQRELSQNLLSIWSKKNVNQMTLNPFSSEKLLPFFIHFQSIDFDSNKKFFSIIRWAVAFLTMKTLDRDWDLLYSRTLINTIVTNQWKTVDYGETSQLSYVGHCLNNLFVYLSRINSVLQYLNKLYDRSSICSTIFSQMVFSFINTFIQKIFATCHLLIIWLDQQTDAFINSGALERSLVICLSDEQLLEGKFHQLIDALRDVPIDPSTTKLFEDKILSCRKIVEEKLSKLFRRVRFNSENYFLSVLPPTNVGLPIQNQSNSIIPTGCQQLLNSLFVQLENFSIESKSKIYEQIVVAFVESWTTTLCERKYRFTEEMATQFLNDFDYFRSFLSKNIVENEIVKHLLQLSCLQQMASIIHFLRTGEKHPTDPSISSLSNRDKWFRSTNSSSSFFDYLTNACCCQRRNRVTTGP